MTNTEINIAIAECCGWVKCLKCDMLVAPHSHFLEHGTPIPNYCEDLNAMWEAEETLTEEEQRNFIEVLIAAKPYCSTGLLNWHVCHPPNKRLRSEAFLRVKGLWKE